VVKRQPARVVGRAAVLAEGAARRGDLMDLPARPGPARVAVAMVARRRKARQRDHRPARRVGRHVVNPGRLDTVVDEITIGRRDWRRERPDLLPARTLDPARADTCVIDVHVRKLARVRVRVSHVDGVAAARGVLHVRPLARHQDQIARRRPDARVVGPDGEGRVVVAAAPEQIRLAFGREAHGIRIRVAANPRRVHRNRLRRLPRTHVLRARGDAVVHRRPHMARVEDHQPAVGSYLDRRVGVVVPVEPRGQHRGHPLTRRVIERSDQDVAVPVDPARVRARVRPRVGDSARIPEPRPGSAPDRRRRRVGHPSLAERARKRGKRRRSGPSDQTVH
jgi:hypothetical protein